MRITSGEFRGRTIKLPAGSELRPSSERLREGLFSALASIGRLLEVRALDLFAGSGSLGLEAISRGASCCTFVEQDRDLAEALRANLSVFGASGRGTVCTGPVSKLLSQGRLGKDARFDLVLIDPPYFETDYTELLPLVAPYLNTDAVIVVESHKNEVAAVEKAGAVVAGLNLFKSKRYGDSALSFLMFQQQPVE